MIRNRAYLLVGIILLGLAPIRPGLARKQAEEPSRLLEPFIDEQTFAVVRIDVTRVDVDAIFRMAESIASGILDAEQAKELTQDWEKIRDKFKDLIAQFKTAGGGTIYLLWSLNYLPDPVVGITYSSREDASALINMLDLMCRDKGVYNFTFLRKPRIILMGKDRAIERLKTASPVARPVLTSAMNAVAEAPIQVCLIPSVDSRRVIEGTLPLMFEQGPKLAPGVITRGFQWAGIAVDLAPRMSLKGHVQSADADSAQALKELWVAASEHIGRIPELQEVLPMLDTTLQMLGPETVDRGLRISLDDQKCRTVVSALIVPALSEVRSKALRTKCAANLHGLGKGLLIYANDHNDKWPPDLETLIQKAEVSPAMLVCGGKPYVYRGIDLGGTSAKPMLIMVHDRAGAHKDGRNVLFVDAHVDWVTEEQFQNLIEQDNVMRHEAGLPEKAADRE